MNLSIAATCVCGCVCACVHACRCFLFCFVPSSAAKGEKKTRQTAEQNKQNTHKGKKVQIYIKRLREKKSHCWEMGNKGSRNNEGEADKSCRPQETGRITMPAECADQLDNRMKKKKTWSAMVVWKKPQWIPTPGSKAPGTTVDMEGVRGTCWLVGPQWILTFGTGLLAEADGWSAWMNHFKRGKIGHGIWRRRATMVT